MSGVTAGGRFPAQKNRIWNRLTGGTVICIPVYTGGRNRASFLSQKEQKYKERKRIRVLRYADTEAGKRSIFVFSVLPESAGNDKIPGIWILEQRNMAFFASAITILQKLVVAIGAGLGVWGFINLM